MCGVALHLIRSEKSEWDLKIQFQKWFASANQETNWTITATAKRSDGSKIRQQKRAKREIKINKRNHIKNAHINQHKSSIACYPLDCIVHVQRFIKISFVWSRCEKSHHCAVAVAPVISVALVRSHSLSATARLCCYNIHSWNVHSRFVLVCFR